MVELEQLFNTNMPYGKYKNYLIYDLPEHYLVRYHNKGFPKNKIGWQMATMYEINLNGLNY